MNDHRLAGTTPEALKPRPGSPRRKLSLAQEHYQSEERREYAEVDNLRDREVEEVETIFKGYGIEGEGLRYTVDAISKDRQRWVDFMMRFELGL